MMDYPNISCLELQYFKFQAKGTLLKLGRYHRTLGVPRDYFGVFGPIFIHVVQPCLESCDLWNEDMEDAWHWLFAYISRTMGKGYECSHFVPRRQSSVSI